MSVKSNGSMKIAFRDFSAAFCLIFGHWLDYMGGIIAVIALVAGVTLEPTTAASKISISVGFLATLFVVFRMAYRVLAVEKRLRPSIRILCGNGHLDCYSDDDGPLGDGKNPLGTYLRMLVINLSDRDLTGVQAILTSVSAGGRQHPQNRRPLLFSPSRPGDPPEKTIKPGATEIVDVVRVDVRTHEIRVPTKGNGQAMFVSASDSSGNDLFASHRPCSLLIEIAANDMKLIKTVIEFDWQGSRRAPEPTFRVISIDRD
jgi:hypothetical protein